MSKLSEPWKGAYVDAVRWASRHNLFAIEIKRESQGAFVSANWEAILAEQKDSLVLVEPAIMRWAHLSAQCRLFEVPQYLDGDVVGGWCGGGSTSLIRILDGKLQMAQPHTVGGPWVHAGWADVTVCMPNEEGTLWYYPESRLVTWEDYIQ